MWDLDNKKGWALKNWWCLRTIVLKKTLESPLDSKEIKSINPKWNQPWIFIGGTDAEALILWPPDVKSWLIGKDPDARKNWRQEEKGTTEDEMVWWYHWLNGHEFEQTLGDGEGQGSLACCSPWVSKSWTQLSEWTTVGLESLSSSSAKLVHPECLGPICVGQRTLSWMKVYSSGGGNPPPPPYCKILTVRTMQSSFSLCWAQKRSYCAISSQPSFQWHHSGSLTLAVSMLKVFVFHCSVAKLYPTLHSAMDCSLPGFPAPHHLLAFVQVHVHCIGDAIQPFHPLSPSSPSAFNHSQHQGLFQQVGCLYHVAKAWGVFIPQQRLQTSDLLPSLWAGY